MDIKETGKKLKPFAPVLSVALLRRAWQAL